MTTQSPSNYVIDSAAYRLNCVAKFGTLLLGVKKIMFELQEDFTSMLAENPTTPNLYSTVPNDLAPKQLRNYDKQCHDIKSNLKNLSFQTGRPQNPIVKVALVRIILGYCPEIGLTGLSSFHLGFRVFDTYYWIEVPEHTGFDQSFHHTVYIGELDCEALCTYDGTLITSYDERNSLECLMHG